MKKLNILAFLITNLIFANSTLANEDCIKGLTKTDMCEMARELSDEIAMQLPMRMSQNMAWESVAAFKTTIQGHIRLSYDRKILEDTYKQAEMPIAYAKNAMQKSARSMCQKGSSTRAFIDLGGGFTVIYSFIDGEQFTKIHINNCN